MKPSWLELLAVDLFDCYLFKDLYSEAGLSFSTLRAEIPKDHFEIIFPSCEGTDVCLIGSFKASPPFLNPFWKSYTLATRDLPVPS